MIQIIISHGKERTSLYCDKCGSGFVWDHIVSKSMLTGVGRDKAGQWVNSICVRDAGTGGQTMRLIDADELIKRMQKWMPKDPCGREQTVEEVVATDIAASVFMEIEETPTVFDKEKVIEELKNLKNNLIDCNDLCGECVETECDQCALDKAIKIVGKGGIE